MVVCLLKKLFLLFKWPRLWRITSRNTLCVNAAKASFTTFSHMHKLQPDGNDRIYCILHSKLPRSEQGFTSTYSIAHFGFPKTRLRPSERALNAINKDGRWADYIIRCLWFRCLQRLMLFAGHDKVLLGSSTAHMGSCQRRTNWIYDDVTPLLQRSSREKVLVVRHLFKGSFTRQRKHDVFALDHAIWSLNFFIL